MGVVINPKSQLDLYLKLYNDPYFVDKSLILEKLNQMIKSIGCYVCVTRPRRFGKSLMTNMLVSYYEKSVNAKVYFDNLKIKGSESYEAHLNKHNVIYLNFSMGPDDCSSYQEYIRYFVKKIKKDIVSEFKTLNLDTDDTVWDLLNEVYEKSGEGFIFVIDEWDYFFHSDFYNEVDAVKYLEFLKSLLKDQVYVELAYMTGILPIAKYSSGSALNMFAEFYFPLDNVFEDYFGFTPEEVQDLLERSRESHVTISQEELSLWYDGYRTPSGKHLYNPRSVNFALRFNSLKNYWTETGPGNEILDFIKNDVDSVRDDVVKLISGEKINLVLKGFGADNLQMKNKNQIFSAMVVYGFLSYFEGQLCIPNYELMKKFEMTLDDDCMGYFAQLVKQSDSMLRATVAGNTEKMESILEFVHNTETPILKYNDENSLSCVVTLCYLHARDRYRVEREKAIGRGYVDFVFFPMNKADTAFILELKCGASPVDAVRQVIEKKYYTDFAKLKDGKPEYTGKVLAVGIAYDPKTKRHSCIVENITDKRDTMIKSLT